MVRLFHVYYPVRTVVLFAGEALLVMLSFLIATFAIFQQDAVLILNYEGGFYKIAAVTAVALLCSHYFDLYESQRLASPGEVYFRLLVVLGVLSFLLAGTEYFFPEAVMAHGTSLLGLFILTLSLLLWRAGYSWLVRQPLLRERVYVLGAGERADRVVEALRTQQELGMDVVGRAAAIGNGALTREEMGQMLLRAGQKRPVDRVIVAMGDRRGRMPVRELLDLRIAGVKIEDATSVLEKVSGKIDVDNLQPSWLIFSDGFSVSRVYPFIMRIICCTLAAIGLVIASPIMLLVAIAIKLDSPGPALFKQARVGQHGHRFTLVKFRSMKMDADPECRFEPVMPGDQRCTRLGHFLRRSRLDELPQLWNILKGDMNLVGPRPFVPSQEEECVAKIPYYWLRWTVKPGATGWAQIKRGYNATLEDNVDKLSYDLFYVKNMSLSLDLMIIFWTFKTLLLGRGGR